MIPLLTSILIGASVAMIVEPADFYWRKASHYYLKDLLHEFEKISYDLPNLDMWLKVWGFSIAVALTLGMLTLKPLLGLDAAFILFVLPEQVLKRLLHKRKTTLKEQLVTAITLVANSAKTGLALEQAFAIVGKELNAPLNKEFSRVAYECKHGRPFQTVLEESKQRLQIQEYMIFVTAATTNKKRGGDITKTLMEIKSSLIENRRLDRKLEADTSSGRMTISSLAIFPIVFLFISYMLNREGTNALFNTTYGNIVLTVATFLTFVGYRWGQKIVDIEF